MPKQSLARAARAEVARSTGIQREYQPPGPWKELSSSRIQRARYDSSRREIHVVFRDGTPWIYNDVPQNIWRNLRRSASPGKFVNRVLDAFPYNQAPADFDEMDAAAGHPDTEDTGSLYEEDEGFLRTLSQSEFGDVFGTGAGLYDDELR